MARIARQRIANILFQVLRIYRSDRQRANLGNSASPELQIRIWAVRAASDDPSI